MSKFIDEFMEKIKKLRKTEENQMEQAFETIPEQYQCYLYFLQDTEVLANKEIPDLPKEITDLGVYTYKNKTLINISKPYFGVDGRIKMAVDECMAKGVHFETGQPEIMEIGGVTTMRVKVTTARGVTWGTAKIGFGGNGVDSTNPIENAETSAIGRALGFQGYGIVGTGIASYEEVALARKEADKLISETPITKTPKSKGNKDEKFEPEIPKNEELKVESKATETNEEEALTKDGKGNADGETQTQATEENQTGSEQTKPKDASPAQIKLIDSLIGKIAKDNGLTEKEFRNSVLDQYSVSAVAKLNNPQASHLIKRLQKQIKEAS